LRIDSSSFYIGVTGVSVDLNAIAATKSGRVYAVGNAGTVLTVDGDSWRPIVSNADIGDVIGVEAYDSDRILILTSKGKVFVGK
jgi:hypothetical protein